MIPTVRLAPEERSNELLHQDTLLIASELFRINGFVLLEGFFATDFIETLHAALVEGYEHYFHDTTFSGALAVGEKRHMITVEIASPFNTRLLYANPLVFPIVQRILGRNCILGGFGAVVSLPEALDQHVHRDIPPLFDPEVDSIIPSFAITMMVPLVDLNDINGSTRIWMGSHHTPDKALQGVDPQVPDVPIGSCYLMDYRLMHQGTANRGKKPRPILYSFYSRSWFRDSENYSKQPRIQISREEYEKLPEAYRSLFSMAKRDGSATGTCVYDPLH